MTNNNNINNNNALSQYRSLVRKNRKKITCQYCRKVFSARELEKHFYQDHLQKFHCSHCHCCPWCSGRYFWLPRQKGRHAAHLTTCFRLYWKQYKVLNVPKPIKSRMDGGSNSSSNNNHCSGIDEQSSIEIVPIYRPYPVCTERELSGRVKLDIHPSAYKLVFLPPNIHDAEDKTLDWWRAREDELFKNKLRFVEWDDLGIRYIRRFLLFQNPGIGWFHLIVRGYALRQFFEQLEEYLDPEDDAKRNRAFLLEFSCWCDGGSHYTEPIHRYHRHMIAVAQDGTHFFNQFWKKIVLPDDISINLNYRYKLCYKIQSWNHLKNTIYYVSSTKSSCDFNLRCLRSPSRHFKLYNPPDEESSDSDATSQDEEDEMYEQLYPPYDTGSHFYIFTPVTSHFKMVAALALDGVDGIREMITSLKGQKRVTPFARHCVRRTQYGSSYTKYAIQIKDVIDPQMERELMHSVVPVRKEWEPTDRIDPDNCSAYLNLMDDVKMYFQNVEKSNNNRDGKEESHKNDQAWAQLQAKKGNLFLDRVKEHYWYPPRNQQRILNELVPIIRQYEAVQGQYEALQSKHEALQSQNEALQNKYEALQSKHEALQNKYETLQLEIKEASQKNIQLTEDFNEQLRKQKHNFVKREMKRKNQIEILKIQLEKPLSVIRRSRRQAF